MGSIAITKKFGAEGPTLSKMLAFRVDDESARRLASLAHARGVFFSDILRDALTMALDEFEQQGRGQV